MAARYKSRSVVRDSVPLLSTESAEEFETRRSNFRDDLRPQNALEKMYTDEIATQEWEIERLKRFKTGLFSLNLRDALYELFVERLSVYDEGQETVDYLDCWFTDAEVKRELSDILAKHGLDVSAIEAEAFRRSSPDWMVIDRLLASAESARDRALRQLILCRDAIVQQRQNKIIDATPIPRIESSRVARS